MAKDPRSDDPEYLSPEGMQGWLQRETEDIRRAADIRIREATGIVEAYVKGEISEDELSKRLYDHSERWGDPIPGVTRTQGFSDEELVAKLDYYREHGFSKRIAESMNASGKPKSR